MTRSADGDNRKINGAAVDSHAQHVLRKGDTVTLRTLGGGDYGDPEDTGRGN